MVRLLVEALFALVFAQALTAYLRRRDPVQRDVMAVFSAAAMLFVLDLARRFLGEPPQVLRATALILLFAQPYLTLRLVHRVRPAPGWLRLVGVVAFVVSVVPVLATRRLPPSALVGILGLFVAVQMTAAVLFAREAGVRTGSPRARFATAAVSTALFGLGLLAASVGTVHAPLREAGQTAGYTMCLVSALGYVVAFRPPAWIRRQWSGTASYRVSRQLLEAPAADAPQKTWSRYARTVREVSGADAVLVVPPCGDGKRNVVTAGVSERTVTADEGDVGRLLRLPEMANLARHVDQLPAFAVGCANEVGARFLTAAALRSPLGASGALVLLSRRRGLFAEDDVQLLAELGGHAALIAERGAVRAEEERLAQELARSVRALSAASQAKSDFLANMSHELRTPLNAIIGFSELMRGERSVGDSRVVPAEWIEHIYASGRHLLDLINDILDLAKIEAGRLELHPHRFELSALVAEAVNTLRPLLERKDLDLRVAVPTLEVWADRTRLRQVLDNLLSNAIKFILDGGRITVEVGRADGEVRLAVVDTGIGISAADAERVFEEFQQVGDLSMQQSGTGLGLALTRRLVEAHGGRMELDSTPGVGSRFTVCLPDAFTAGAQASGTGPADDGLAADGGVAAVAGSAARDKAGVLLIEDDPGAARLLRTYLESAGYRVRVADTGEEGLAAARRERPDAVVLDVLLPGIDGWGVLRALKQDERLHDVPVFVVSVVDERDVGLSLGAADFFVKPIDRRRLLASVAEFLLATEAASGRMHVLAVDDDPATLDVLARALRAQQVDVVTAGTGQEAVRLARTRPFDLIISDLMMPDIDGVSLMSALDKDPVTSRIPVLVVTGSSLGDGGSLDPKALGILPKGDAVLKALHHWMTTLPRPSAQPAGTTGNRGTGNRGTGDHATGDKGNTGSEATS
ncbi:MAG TPA: response regulator [Planosporangium sp.]|jgi:signal transduction histidine kinase/DNA-binding response OmpR family regulator|nr:response regulator [Planosporangium sp.]